MTWFHLHHRHWRIPTMTLRCLNLIKSYYWILMMIFQMLKSSPLQGRFCEIQTVNQLQKVHRIYMLVKPN